MSDYDRNVTTAKWGQTIGRVDTAAIDQGLRSYMLGVYNYMTVGLAITGLVAMATNMLAVAETATGGRALTTFGQALYLSPLKWLVMLAPLAFVFFFSFGLNQWLQYKRFGKWKNYFRGETAYVVLSLVALGQLVVELINARTQFAVLDGDF